MQGWCGVGPAIAVLALGIGAVPGEPSIDCSAGKAFSRVALCRKHGPGEIVSWTGYFPSRRELLGLNLRWSYAPAEVKVLTSVDGGNFEEAAQWHQISRSEPSFEESIMFPAPVAAKAVKVLMRGAKPWGYFGIAKAAALAGPSAFMLVSGAPAPQEQCVVSSGNTLAVEACLDVLVDGDGRDVFQFSEAGHLQAAGGQCVEVAASKLVLSDCSNAGAWEATADGQMKQGNMCLTASGSHVEAMDCEEAAATGGGKFFQVAVPAFDPGASQSVRSLGTLLQASATRQRKLTAALQGLLPKLGACKASASLAARISNSPASRPAAFVATSIGEMPAQNIAGLAAKVSQRFGLTSAEVSEVLLAAHEAVGAVGKAGQR